jgi:hypothetical protein
MAYSFVGHLARVLYFDRYRSVPVVMFTAYFDTSGDKRMSVITTSGFVSRVKKWDRFDRGWPSVLEPYGVTSLHTTEFVSRQGQFQSWTKSDEDTARRRRFVDDVVSFTDRHINKGFSVNILMSEYDQINSIYQVSERMGSPYAVCGMCFLSLVAKWAEKRGYDPRKVIYVAEKGDEGQGEFISRAAQDGLTVVTKLKAEIQAFQMCDFLAWKTRALIHDAANRTMPTEEAEFMRMIDTLNPVWPILHKYVALRPERVEMMCRAKKIPLRQGETIVA